MNIAGLLKSEIVRLARKELKSELEAVRKSISAHRSALAKLKREIDTLQRQLKALRKGAGRVQAKADAAGDQGSRPRFSAKGLASHRQRLGFSREQYGALLGVSGQSVYKWERGEARPRQAQLLSIAAARGLGKREALARLESAGK